MIMKYMHVYQRTVIIKTVNIAFVVCVPIFITAERAAIVCCFLLFFDTVSILHLMFSVGNLTSLTT